MVVALLLALVLLTKGRALQSGDVSVEHAWLASIFVGLPNAEGHSSKSPREDFSL
jgi:hypothetical protein